ncbi:hypothetical protein Peur_049099 [Populus x canadensis]
MMERRDGVQEPCIWSSPEGGKGEVEPGKRIFCSRVLNMRSVKAVGLHMDYTLAQYKPETFEKLVLLEWKFGRDMVRGLVLDKKRGNILKMDRHKYVKVAYHGFTELSKEEKVNTYGNTLIRNAFDWPDYVLVDTHFSLAEAYLFAQLVEFMDKYRERVRTRHIFLFVFGHTRYLSEDKSIVPMLRDSKRATFLVTNSLGFFSYQSVYCWASCRIIDMTGWRTMLIVPELEREVRLLWEQRNSNKFHKVWGQLMKTGYQNSRFAHQVERFACLFTILAVTDVLGLQTSLGNQKNYSPK